MAKDLSRKRANRATLSDKEVLRIFNSKLSLIKISQKYKVSYNIVHKIKTGFSYSYVTGAKYVPKPRLTEEEKKQRFNEYRRKQGAAKYETERETRRLARKIREEQRHREFLTYQEQRKAKEVQLMPNREINLSELIRVAVDAKTVVYVKPGTDLGALKEKYRAKLVTEKGQFGKLSGLRKVTFTKPTLRD